MGKIIDTHGHLFNYGFLPQTFNWSTAMNWAYHKPPYRDPEVVMPRIMPGLADPEGTWLISQMDEAGTDITVLLPVDFGIEMGDDQEVTIDEMHKFYGGLMKKYPGRVIAFAGQDPRRPEALEIFERAVKEYGLRGLKMYPNCGYYPHDPVCYPFYERCQEWGIPVTSHIAPSTYPHRTRFAHPQYYADVIVDFPDLIIWWAHAGHTLWFEDCLEVMKGHLHSYLEMSTWHKAVEEDEGAFIRLLSKARDQIGAHRIIFGSDQWYSRRWSGANSLGGFGLKRWVDWWRELRSTAKKHGVTFTQEEVDWMLGENAARCLGLEKRPEWEIRKFNLPPRMPRPSEGHVHTL